MYQIQKEQQTVSSSFCHRSKGFFNNQITYMTKLLICVITNLLVNKLIAELLDNFSSNRNAIFRFKHHFHRITLRLLMNKESVSKLIASSDKCFFGI